MDQAETEFLKGRSLAINAAAHALKSAGFALPEPIYRLPFDESAPLLLKNMGTVAMEKPAGDTPPPVGIAPDEDTSPDTHVERMVTEEPAETGKNDLLNSGRPTE